MDDPAHDEELVRHLLSLHEASPLLLAVFDDRDVLSFANLAFREAFDARPDGQLTWLEMMRANCASGRGNVVSAADKSAWLAAAASRRGKQPFRAFEADLMDGRWIWMSETMDANGWMYCSASDITALKQDGRALRQERDRALRAAQTDALTGISNRAHVLQQLQDQLDRLRERGGRLAVVLLDLDHFKRINDSLGHQAGDLVICDFARQLQLSTRRGDGCGRLGGEEFMLLLGDVDRPQAQAIVERLLQRLRQARPLAEQPALSYSASAGLAMADAQDSLAELCRRADQALYLAKDQGRDRCVADSDE